MEQTHHTDHAKEAIDLIDRVLAEETTVLDGLKRAVDNNWLSPAEADAQMYSWHIEHAPPLPDTEP